MKQKTVAISSTEAEYIGMSEATKEAIWFQAILKELGIEIKQVVMCGDNLSCMSIIRNPTDHHRTKHIDVRYHSIRDHFEQGRITLKYIESNQLCADFLTKGVERNKHYNFMKQLNLIN